MTDKKNKIWNNLLIVLIIANVVLVLYYFNQNRFSDAATDYTQDAHALLNEMKNIHLEYLQKDKKFNEWLRQPVKKLLLIFSPNDCPACLHSIKAWNNISTHFPKRVFAIVPYQRINEIKLFLLNENVKFYVGINRDKKVYNYIKRENSPFQIILTKDNDVYLARKAYGDPKSWNELVHLFYNLKN